MAASFSARQMQNTRLAASCKLRRELNLADRSLRRTLAHVSLLEALDRYEPKLDDTLHLERSPKQPPNVSIAASKPSHGESPVSPIEDDRENQLSDDDATNLSDSDSISDEEAFDWDDEQNDDSTIYEVGDDVTVIRILQNTATLSDIDAHKSGAVEEVLELREDPKQDLTPFANPHSYAAVSVDVQECDDDF